jgi:RNA polymerase sigma factor (sigma-70 family)
LSDKKKHIIAEEDLISLLSIKNKRAIEILYDNYSSTAFGIIFRIVKDEKVSEDILQETFIRIWNNSWQYKSSKGRLFTWIINIARHLAIDKLRSKESINISKNQSLEKIVSHNIQASTTDSVTPELIGLRELVDALNPEQKNVIDLLYFGGFTQNEVAEKLQIPLGTVKTRSRNALLNLRVQFEVGNIYK